ncbi:hypothetical protein [Rhodococcus sp. NPDC049939]|uniref:hypothetical protein n=1 Tax=Rhodococcus sp. NPDC049939 TaxID=3155511 RepID=UPI00340D50D7
MSEISPLEQGFFLNSGGVQLILGTQHRRIPRYDVPLFTSRAAANASGEAGTDV